MVTSIIEEASMWSAEEMEQQGENDMVDTGLLMSCDVAVRLRNGVMRS